MPSCEEGGILEAMIIREAEDADVAAMVDLLAELGYDLTPSELTSEIDAEPGTVVFVAEIGAAVVGMIVANTRRHLHRAALVTSIDSLVVTSGSRSKGVGEALVDAVLDRAREVGSTLADVHSHLDRTDATRFYERMGFELVSNYFLMGLRTRR